MTTPDEDILQHLFKLFYDDMNFCGCGSPEDAYELVHDLLKWTPFYENEHWRVAQEFVGSRGAWHIVLYVMTYGGLITHGGSVGGSWITNKGRWAVWALNHIGVDGLSEKIDEVGLPHHGDDCIADCYQIPEGVL